MLQDLDMLRWNRASKFQNPALEFITENFKIYMVLSFLDVAFSSRYLLDTYKSCMCCVGFLICFIYLIALLCPPLIGGALSNDAV